MKLMPKHIQYIFIICFVQCCFAQIVYADSDNKDALKLHEEGITSLKAKQYDKAIKYFTESIKLKPDSKVSYGSWIMMGLAYRGLGQLNKAIESFIEGLRVVPVNENLHLILAENYFLQGQYVKAVDSYKQAVSLKPDYADAHIGLGTTYLFLNRETLAAEHYYKAGLLYIEQDNRAGATSAYEGLKELNSKELESKLLEKLNPEHENLNK